MDYSQYEICRLIEAIDKVKKYIDWDVECTLEDATRDIIVAGLKEVKTELLQRLK